MESCGDAEVDELPGGGAASHQNLVTVGTVTLQIRLGTGSERRTRPTRPQSIESGRCRLKIYRLGKMCGCAKDGGWRGNARKNKDDGRGTELEETGSRESTGYDDYAAAAQIEATTTPRVNSVGYGIKDIVSPTTSTVEGFPQRYREFTDGTAANKDPVRG
jgi:hypothetical protein